VNGFSRTTGSSTVIWSCSMSGVTRRIRSVIRIWLLCGVF
jgi:hypothetical protein